MSSGPITRRRFLGYTAAGVAASCFAPTLRAHAAVDWTEPKYVQTNGIRMAYYEMGTGFPIIFSHGFPELAYSWRHQLPAVAAAGFRAIAPDQRGYGLTDRPDKIEGYTIQHLTGDLVGLMDALKIDKAVFCGHDWGGMVVWMMGVLHPDRVAGIIGVNTPFIPRGPVAPTQMLKQMRGENNYIVAFQEPGVADKILGDNTEKAFRMFMRAGGTTAEEFAKLPADSPARNFEILTAIQGPAYTGPLLISEDDLKFYVDTYTRTGFTGGINWYRNMDRNWETTADKEYKVKVPAMYVGAEDDVVLPPSMANGIEQWVPDIEKHTIQDCGHWTQQQKPDELNKLIVDFMKRKFG